MKRCLFIFAKEPEKGRVKTRLAGYLGEEASLVLYKAFIQDTIDIVRRVQAEEKVLAYEAGSDEPVYLRERAEGFNFYHQNGKDLGERMGNAFRYARDRGFGRTVIIGSDAPTLPAELIDEAFRKLRSNDLVLGPSRDGGYYLIGARGWCPALFDNVVWSSDHVLGTTVYNAEKANHKVQLLDPWYDIDTPDDLDRLREELTKRSDAARNTRKALYER